MPSPLKIGQTALEVCQTIIDNYPSIITVRIRSHTVGKNWRQINTTLEEKLSDLQSSFFHGGQTGERIYRREDFLALRTFEPLPENEVWSFCSRVGCADGKCRHIAMMNFHPEEGIGLADIKRVMQYLCGSGKGALLETDRYHHYYGNFLLEEKEWHPWMANFLMPCIVSPRYIGHMIWRGHCFLRLSTDSTFKTKTPRVVDLV